jgi:uncharacterized protein (DUF1499 family)
MRAILLIIAVLAFAAAAAIAVAGPGTHLGWWDYGVGLTIMRGMKLPAITLAGLAGVSFIIALFRARNLSALLLLATVVAGCAAIVPIKFEQLVGANPFIHDITTDFDHPPQIVAGAALPRKNPPEYVGAQQAPRSDLTTAEAQKKAFPDIKPIVVDLGIEEAAKRVRATLQDMNMDILQESSNGASTIEAAYTSFWFGFTDDFIVRLTTKGERTRVDVRSKSRVGVSDLGANAGRVREFYSKLQGL